MEETAIPTMAIEDPEDQPNYLMGVLAGGIAMLLGALVWGIITYLTNYQIGIWRLAWASWSGLPLKSSGAAIRYSTA